MFVRRKINPNGSCSVTVVDKSSGKYKTVVTLGTTRDPLEIDRLEAKGREYIRNKSDYPELPLFGSVTDEWVDEFVTQSDSRRLQLAGPDIVLGSVFDNLGFDKIDLPMFRHMVVSRCYGHPGIIGTSSYLKEYTLEDHPLSELSASLDEICHKSSDTAFESVRLNVERINMCRFVRADEYLILADFVQYKAPTEDELRVLGKKKAPKAPAKVGLVLLVTADGRLVAYETCTPVTLSGKRFFAVIDSLRKRYSADDVTVVAGADVLGPAAIDMLNKKGIKYLYSSSSSKKTVEGAVYARNERLAEKSKELREAGLVKLQKKIDAGKVTEKNVGGKGYNKYLKLEGDSLVIDKDLVQKDSQNDGIQMFLSNVEIPAEVITRYSSILEDKMARFAVEGADLLVRPILYRSRNRIDGHICLCYVSELVVAAFMDLVKKAGLQVDMDAANKALSGIMQMDYISEDTGKRRRQLVKMGTLQKALFALVDDTHLKER